MEEFQRRLDGLAPLKKTHKGIYRSYMRYPDWLNTEAWEAWEIHRKEIKKRLTPSAIRLQWKLLQQYDKETQLEMIENSIRCSWTGLFPLKASPKKTFNFQTAPEEIISECRKRGIETYGKSRQQLLSKLNAGDM